MVNQLNCDIVVNEFELQSRNYVHFLTNTLGKGKDPFIPRYGLKSTIAVLLQERPWH